MRSFVGLVWIYPIPCAVVNPRSIVFNDPSAAVNGSRVVSGATIGNGLNGVNRSSTVGSGSNGVNGPNIAVNGPNTSVNGLKATINGSPTVINGPMTVKDPSTIVNDSSTVVVNDPTASIDVKNSSVAVDGHGPGAVISIAVPALQWPPAPVPNIWLISSAKLTDDMINMKRTMLNNLANKNMRNASTSPSPHPASKHDLRVLTHHRPDFLVVVLERRKRPDSKSIVYPPPPPSPLTPNTLF